jgi:hypothetical protein
MERLVTDRLTWFLESNNLLSSLQSGFRRSRSVTDHIATLCDKITKAMANKQHTLGIFLDFEKAFDLVWHKGLTVKLKNLGVQGKIFAWIENFFQDCTIQVKVGSQISDSYRLENGTAQGSVISPLLFIIMINDLTRDLTNTEASLFADDTAIFRSSRNIKFLSAIMNKNLENISKWCDIWGFKISMSKTVAVCFSKAKNQRTA